MMTVICAPPAGRDCLVTGGPPVLVGMHADSRKLPERKSENNSQPQDPYQMVDFSDINLNLWQIPGGLRACTVEGNQAGAGTAFK